MNTVAFLIDDNFDDRVLFKRALRVFPFHVSSVYSENGFQALTKLQNESFTPDFIFININMPGMDGIECLQEIRKIKRLSSATVYMYSASVNETVVESCMKLGASGVILKTPDVKLLGNILLEAFQREKIAYEMPYGKQLFFFNR